MSILSPRIDLFKFVESNSGKVYRLTNSNKSAFIGEEEYLPAAITRSAIEQTEELNKTTQEIVLPISNAMARRWTFNGMENTVSLVMFSQKGDETKVIWRGNLSIVKPESSSITLEFIDMYFRLQRKGMGATFTRNCRHSLYSSQCGVIQNLRGISGMASTEDGQTISIPETSSFKTGFFSGGILQTSDGSMHTVSSSQHGIVYLMTKSNLLLDEFEDKEVKIFPGCNKTTSDCKEKFNNLANFGGFPWIPTKDIYDGTPIQGL